MGQPTTAANAWVADLAAKLERYGCNATSPYLAADLCGYCSGFGDGSERTEFVHAFTMARELAEQAAGRPNAVEFLRG